MKTVLLMVGLVCMARLAQAQFIPNETTYCNPFGTGTMCSNSQGSTMISPLGPSTSIWSNSQGQSGTIIQPVPIQPMVSPGYPQPYQPYTTPSYGSRLQDARRPRR